MAGRAGKTGKKRDNQTAVAQERQLAQVAPARFNVAEVFIDRNVREGKGAKVAIECGEEKVTYSELLENTNRVGNVLRGLGVRSEERVLLLLPDTPEFLYAFFGAIKIGAVAVPLNTLLKQQEYEYLFNDARARVLIASAVQFAELQSLPKDRLGYFPLYCGATTILSPARPTPASAFADIERYRPTLFFSVPTNYAALLEWKPEGRQEFDLSSVRHAISAGEALPASIFARFKERFGIEILDAWG